MATEKMKALLTERIREALSLGESRIVVMPVKVNAPSWILPAFLASFLFGVYGGIYLNVVCTLAIPVGLALGVLFNVKRKYYFLAATENSLVVLKRWTRRPVAVLPISALAAATSEDGAPAGTLRLMFPGSRQPTTLRVDRTWRAEFDQLLALRPSVESGVRPA